MAATHSSPPKGNSIDVVTACVGARRACACVSCGAGVWVYPGRLTWLCWNEEQRPVHLRGGGGAGGTRRGRSPARRRACCRHAAGGGTTRARRSRLPVCALVSGRRPSCAGPRNALARPLPFAARGPVRGARSFLSLVGRARGLGAAERSMWGRAEHRHRRHLRVDFCAPVQHTTTRPPPPQRRLGPTQAGGGGGGKGGTHTGRSRAGSIGLWLHVVRPSVAAVARSCVADKSLSWWWTLPEIEREESTSWGRETTSGERFRESARDERGQGELLAPPPHAACLGAANRHENVCEREGPGVSGRTGRFACTSSDSPTQSSSSEAHFGRCLVDVGATRRRRPNCSVCARPVCTSTTRPSPSVSVCVCVCLCEECACACLARATRAPSPAGLSSWRSPRNPVPGPGLPFAMVSPHERAQSPLAAVMRSEGTPATTTPPSSSFFAPSTPPHARAPQARAGAEAREREEGSLSLTVLPISPHGSVILHHARSHSRQSPKPHALWPI